MRELPLAASADNDFVGIENAASIAGEEYFFFISRKSHAGDLCSAHELRTTVLSPGAHQPLFKLLKSKARPQWHTRRK